MNISIVRYILGWVLCFLSVFLILPFIVSLFYKESQGLAFILMAIICAILGILSIRKKPKSHVFFAKEGFVTVALSWLLISFVGSVPFVINGDIPIFIDALFETVSGFTTTGASILTDVEALSYSSLFWRSFTHWIGGMGVLVFILAILPLAGGHGVHLMRAESPGHNVGKLVPRIRRTAFILYAIYVFLTILEVILLCLGGMNIFESLTTSFGTAGTGGFGVKNDSIMGYSPYIQWVITIFMIMFGINFNVYYLILIRKISKAIKTEEIRYYLGIIIVAVILVFSFTFDKFETGLDSLRHSAFQVASIITTTGFATADFNVWSNFAKAIIVLLMFIGACAGSTGGGIKVSRIIILFKSVKNEIQNFLHPRSTKVLKFEQGVLESDIIRKVSVFLVSYLIIFVLSIIIITADGFSLVTNFTAVAATINNIGPGLEMVGPIGNYSEFGIISKIVLIFDMLAGRLEIFPMLILFTPTTWKKV